MIQFLLALFVCAQAKEIDTNAVIMANAPDWLNRPRVERIIDRMQTKLEWTVRKVPVTFYPTQEEFTRQHNLGSGVRAVTFKRSGAIHIGPTVTHENFDSVFGHELVHVILGQKYKEAVPDWLEEGLANHLAKYGKVNYPWLAKQPFPDDVRKLTHPFKATVSTPHYHYQASQALAEMIAKKCDMENLLRLSVERKLENYLETYCEIKDLNAEFKKWVLSRK